MLLRGNMKSQDLVKHRLQVCNHLNHFDDKEEGEWEGDEDEEHGAERDEVGEHAGRLLALSLHTVTQLPN